MFESIEKRRSVPVYVQIEDEVVFAVAAGKLKGGDKLPSLRELAEKLNLNLNTMAKAYRDLELMGIVYTRHGIGIFISKGIEAKCREDDRKRVVGRLHEVVSEAKAAGMASQDIKNICSTCFA